MNTDPQNDTKPADKRATKEECICGGGPHRAKRCPVHASTLTTAPDPTPAGKLSDKELGEIGAEACGFTIELSDKWTPIFARAVREQVEKECETELEKLKDAHAMEFICLNEVLPINRDGSVKIIDHAIATVRYLTAASAQQAEEIASLQRSYEGERNCSAERMTQILNLQREVERVTAERDRLQWRPVSVKPTREDADIEGYISVIDRKGEMDVQRWNEKLPAYIKAWRACYPPASTAEEAERSEFESFWSDCHLQHVIGKESAFKIWHNSRASKKIQP